MLSSKYILKVARMMNQTDMTGVSPSGPAIINNDGDWPEDASHENGKYLNVCRRCGRTFIGHKRRVECKKCYGTPTILEEYPGAFDFIG